MSRDLSFDLHRLTARLDRAADRILQAEFGVTYSLQGAYDLLHRLGYSYLRPRPRHRKNDPAAMQAWLKDAPLLPRASGTSTPTRRSRSGSRMKPASGRKAR